MQWAAKGAHACRKLADAEVERVAGLVVKPFVGGADVVKANQFPAAQEDAAAKNPPLEVAWPEPPTEELNRGVKANITPLQEAGVLAVRKVV